MLLPNSSSTGRRAVMEPTPPELLHKTLQLLQHRIQLPDLIRKEAKRSKIQQTGGQISNCMSHYRQNQHDNAQLCSWGLYPWWKQWDIWAQEYSFSFKTLLFKNRVNHIQIHLASTSNALQADPSLKKQKNLNIWLSHKFCCSTWWVWTVSQGGSSHTHCAAHPRLLHQEPAGLILLILCPFHVVESKLSPRWWLEMA